MHPYPVVHSGVLFRRRRPNPINLLLNCLVLPPLVRKKDAEMPEISALSLSIFRRKFECQVG